MIYKNHEKRLRNRRLRYQNKVKQKETEFDLWTQKKWIKNQLINSKGAVCGICGKPIKDMRECTIDHIRPVSKGGLTTIDNCQLAHPWCNKKKGNTYVNM